MKKYLFLLILAFSLNILHSQEIADAVRFSQENITGTARFRAMSGAFGALGGDLSSLNVNPAGSAVFNNNQLTTTLSSLNTKNNSNYFGTQTSESENSFVLNQTGGVFVFKNQNPTSNWKKFSIAINYENSNDFNNAVFSAGTNPTNSVDGYFLSYANGIELSTLENFDYYQLDNGPQQAFLGYNAFIIDPVNPVDDNVLYKSNVTPGGNYYQENNVYTQGHSGKLSFNAATSYKNRLYFGINLNSHFTDYTRSSNFYESNNNPLNSTDYSVRRIIFDNYLYTYGSGFSFQIGAIGKITNEIRIGLAYESPIWYNLNDEFTQKLVAVSANNNGELPADIVNPNITNFYAPYKIQTPGKITGSFAYIFGKTGLISVDYTLKDYSNTKFKPENDPYFRDLNNLMSTTLAFTNEIRLGAEYKIKELSLRGGYRYEQSPYKNAKTIGDLNGYSGGLGYNFGLFKLDLAYSYAQRNTQQAFFSQGFTDSANINTKNNNFTMTALFEM